MPIVRSTLTIKSTNIIDFSYSAERTNNEVIERLRSRNCSTARDKYRNKFSNEIPLILKALVKRLQLFMKPAVQPGRPALARVLTNCDKSEV